MSELTNEVLKELAKPFPANKISIKVQTKPNDNGNALCVAYIDARDVMERLDAVVGGDWSDDYRAAPSGGLECALTVMGVTRRDVGDDKNDNETEKAGYSDAFKRAAVKFGIGRFLYDMPKMYGKVKQIGKNYYLADGEEERLRGIINKALAGEKVSTSEPARTVQSPQSSDKGKVDQPKPEKSPERAELVKAFSASFNAVPQERKGETMTITGNSTDDEIRKATAHNLKLMEGVK